MKLIKASGETLCKRQSLITSGGLGQLIPRLLIHGNSSRHVFTAGLELVLGPAPEPTVCVFPFPPQGPRTQ